MGAAESYKPGTFARFFMPVKGRLVSRFGTQRATHDGKKWTGWRNNEVIGGSRRPLTEREQLEAAHRPAVGRRMGAKPCNPVELDLESVTAITSEEAAKYGREYDRAVRQKSLKEVTEEDYIAWLAKCDEQDEAARRRAAAAATAAEKEKKLAAELEAARANPPAVAASGRTDEPEAPA